MFCFANLDGFYFYSMPGINPKQSFIHWYILSNNRCGNTCYCFCFAYLQSLFNSSSTSVRLESCSYTYGPRGYHTKWSKTDRKDKYLMILLIYGILYIYIDLYIHTHTYI